MQRVVGLMIPHVEVLKTHLDEEATAFHVVSELNR
jgi:hypothetical protein